VKTPRFAGMKLAVGLPAASVKPLMSSEPGTMNRFEWLKTLKASSRSCMLYLQFTARYTLSSAKDNLSSTFSDSNANGSLGLLDPFDPNVDYGYADFDSRHRFVTSLSP
jgi:hypothetical protein